MLADDSEFFITSNAHSRWWRAVSRGWNPSPGGVIYVCLTLDKTVDEPSGLCWMTPAPSLFAEPSRPNANTDRSKFILTEVRRVAK